MGRIVNLMDLAPMRTPCCSAMISSAVEAVEMSIMELFDLLIQYRIRGRIQPVLVQFPDCPRVY